MSSKVLKFSREMYEKCDENLLVYFFLESSKNDFIVERVNHILKLNDENKSCEKNILFLSSNSKGFDKLNLKLDFFEENLKFDVYSFFFEKILRKYCLKIEALGLDLGLDFKILDDVSRKIFFLKNLDSFNITSVKVKNNRAQVAKDIEKIIFSFKKRGVKPVDFEKVKSDKINEKIDILKAYVEYEKYKKKNSFFDRFDVAKILFDFFSKDENLVELENIRDEFSYLILEKFEDLSKFEIEFLNLFLKNRKGVLVFNEVEKSNFSFFSSLSFFNEVENYNRVSLDEDLNFDGKTIDKINSFLKKEFSYDGSLILENNEGSLSESIKVVPCSFENSQMTYISEKVSEILEKDKNLKVGVVVRKVEDGLKIMKFFDEVGILYGNHLRFKFYRNEIVREILFFLEVIDKPYEANTSLFYILSNFSLRSLTLRKISRKASMNGNSIFKVLCDNDKISEFDEENVFLNSFCEKLKGVVDYNLRVKSDAYKVLRKVVDVFEFYKSLILEDDFKGISSLNQLIDYAFDFSCKNEESSVFSFLENIDFIRDLNLDLGLDLGLDLDLGRDKVFLGVNLILAEDIESFDFDFDFDFGFDYLIYAYFNDNKVPLSYFSNVFGFDVEFERKEFFLREKLLFFKSFKSFSKELVFTYVKKYDGAYLSSEKSSFLKDFDFYESDVYDKKLRQISFDSKEEMKINIIKKVGKLLLANDFEGAKREIDILKNLFGKKDLNAFLNPEVSLKLEEFKENMDSDFIENVDFDNSKMVYSVSQIKTYESCPKKYLFQYIYKIPTTPRHYFDFGTSVHSTLEYLVPEIDKGLSKEVLFSMGIAYLHKVWISIGYEDEKQEKEYFEKGSQAISYFLDREFEIRKEGGRKTVAMEKKFFIELEGRRIIGFIDRIDKIDEGYEILDYKTSNSMESRVMLEESVQLYVYALALEKLEEFCDYPLKMGLWYLIFDKISKVDFKMAKLEKVRKKIVGIFEEIEKKNFKAKPSDFACTYCDFNKICKDSLKK